ncbi:MAG: hypothetical protein AAFV53_05090, partial [Myxococcota bacterium]
RFCVESVEHQQQLRWATAATFPYVSVWWEAVSVAQVRPLSVREPSWMWERPVYNHPTSSHRTVVSTADVTAGAVWYIDAAVIDGRPDPDEPLAIADDRMRPHVLSAHDRDVELEMCPEVRGALAAR